MDAIEAPIHRLSVEDVARMSEAGVFGENDRVELVDGILVDVPMPSPEHSGVVAWLNRQLVENAGNREVRVQDVLLVEGGFFVPDLMVVEAPARDRHPTTAALVVEVSVSTHRHDIWKTDRYAIEAVGEYWIVDAPGRLVHVHRRLGPAGYNERVTHRDGERITSGDVTPEIDVSALLG